MMERWVISIYPRYMVSQLGNVYDSLRDRVLTATPDRAGYLRVKLWLDGKRVTHSIHRLVAASFYDVEEIREVNHIDGDKTNNAIWNLEISDRSENMLHAFRMGLAKPVFAPIAVRCRETGEEFQSTGQAGRWLSVSSGSVSKQLRGFQPTVRGYTFELI